MCTRVVYLGPDQTVLTARSMDWKEDIHSNLWAFPRGMTRHGSVGPRSLIWELKYGSLIASGYDISTTDGLNEKGLSANILWLVESDYTPWDDQNPGLSIAAWAQYVLDTCATVQEVVDVMNAETFAIVTTTVPGKDFMATLHLSVSDASGDSAIFEYIGGKLVIHHDRAYQVMTNSPTFEKQLALNEYWQDIGGTVMLPGTDRAADRFVRASFYINAIPKVDDTRLAAASVFSVIRNCSVPLGISTPDQPNIASTLWRTVADHKNLLYFFESTLSPNIFWVDLKELDFSPGAEAMKLDLGDFHTYAENAASQFMTAQPFEFAGV